MLRPAPTPASLPRGGRKGPRGRITMRRKPAVAGYFYPAEPSILRAEIERLLAPPVATQPVKAVVSPHAGIQYSGAVAGAVYAHLRVPEVFLLLGPNHAGLGSPM